MGSITWFRAPADDHPGTLNACYHALDLPVIHGRADEVAIEVGGTGRTYAWLLTEVAACAGVLQAFGVGVGDEVALDVVDGEAGLVACLAVARVGAVAAYADPTASAPVRVAARGGVVFRVDGEDLPWDVAMRAGRTDPAPVADVPGDAVLARHGTLVLTVLDALAAAPGAPDDQQLPLPPGATLAEVGGLRLWSFDTP